ncbi:hypothetical protein [Phaeobacter sp. NW0010-22]|uniref:hypothetical protein n=1 Tax=Phaeobacter sp. NW0010-22 TaxID=3135907 RepID=UPI0031054BD3
MEIEDTVYPGSYYSLMRFLDRKEIPYAHPETVLPAADVDLAALKDQIVRFDPDHVPPDDLRDARRKRHALEQEFDGGSALHLLHALVISLLRRSPAPTAAQDLFFRLWTEQGQHLAQTLPVRWLISAATTFGDHGQTPEQIKGGSGLAMLFDLIKLHDSERRVSGRANDHAYSRVSGRKIPPLAFGMAGYSLTAGDLDKIMLARLWRLAEDDAILRPLGFRMLGLVMTDKRSIFARMRRYKGK